MTLKRKYLTLSIFLALLLTALTGLTTTYWGATSYTNAKEFYHSTEPSKPYHVETANGTIYYATCAKQASSTSNLRYYTLGFDISLSGNGHTLSFAVKRNGDSMVEIDSHSDQTYVYNLYAINDSTLYQLASKANPTAASYILDAASITVKMDAILTTKRNDTPAGSIK